MKRCAAILSAFAVLLAGCGLGVDSRPGPAADAKARESIVAGGGDPERWIVRNACGSAGTCGVQLAPRCDPSRVLAINRYRIKDSFPTLLGPDRIARMVGRPRPC
ncbi:MAG: hypothetical protein U0R51_12080 [Solirubrobacterales bacterium]